MPDAAKQVSVTFDKAKLKELESVLAGVKNGVPRAASAAINRTVSTGKVRIARRIHGHINLRIGRIKEAMSVQKATVATMEGRIKFSRRPIPLIDYGAKDEYPTGVTVTVRHDKGEERLNSAFVRTMASGHEGVFIRRPASSRIRRRAGHRGRDDERTRQRSPEESRLPG